MPQAESPGSGALKRCCRIFVAVVYLVGCAFFYYRYVPLIKPFQLALAPLLACLFILTSLKREWGTFLFVFLFPLVNNLPYFFDIYENIPHAPTALILFLAYFGGVLASAIFRPFPLRLSHRVWKPLALFALLVLVSGLITFIRYANFFPFLTGGIYEIIVNVNHVRAGGALMSVLFNFLNYSTGLLLFFMLLNLITSPEFIRRLFVLLSFSTLVSLGFAFFQKYSSPGLGNTPFWVKLHQINSTFKDPNSFGLFLCALAPVFLGLVLAGSRRSRAFYALLLTATLFILPLIGTRIAFIALLISLFVFLILSLLSSSWSPKKKAWVSLALVFFTILMVLSFSLFSRKNILSERLTWSFSQLSKGENLASVLTLRLNLWDAACLMVKDYPLTGVGLGGYIVELPNYLKLKNLPSRKTDSAENYFLQIGAELGLIGFLAFLWLILEIVRQMKSRWRALRNDLHNQYVLIGTITGILAVFINYFFHSFIGGFEAKYLFWALLAILFASPETGPEPPAKKKRPTLLLSGWAILTILFISLHVWNSLHSLSVSSRAEKFGWPRDFGLYKLEKDSQNNPFRWTRKTAGWKVEKSGPILVLPLRASHPDIATRPVGVKIYLADQRFRKKDKVGEITLRHNDWVNFECSLAGREEDHFYLVLETDRTWRPFQHWGVADSRSLAVALGREWFKYPENIGESAIRARERLPASLWQGKSGNRLFSNGVSTMDFRTREKTGAIRLWVKGQKAFGMGPYIIIKADGRTIGRTMVNEEKWAPLVFPFSALPGPHRLSVEFSNDISDRGQDRNVSLGDLEVLYER